MPIEQIILTQASCVDVDTSEYMHPIRGAGYEPPAFQES